MLQAVLIAAETACGLSDLQLCQLKNSKLLQPIIPGDQLLIEGDITGDDHGDVAIKARLFVADQKCAEFSLIARCARPGTDAGIMHAPRRQKGGYFPIDPAAPAPLVVRLTQRIAFSDVDPMGILWHGRYAKLFEKANEALGVLCGMTYADFYRDRILRTDRAVSRGLLRPGCARRRSSHHWKNVLDRSGAGSISNTRFIINPAPWRQRDTRCRCSSMTRAFRCWHRPRCRSVAGRSGWPVNWERNDEAPSSPTPTWSQPMAGASTRCGTG